MTGSDGARDHVSRILSRDDVIAEFGPPRPDRLVFTNGCFDIIHRGHIDYLSAARRLGERLVIGVNTDSSVRRLKGPGRPFVSERDRAQVLAALACVDAVTLFDEDTPRALIAALSPEVLVKGGDYEAEEVVGYDEVVSAGGEVVILPYLDGYSTSSLVQRIRRNESVR